MTKARFQEFFRESKAARVAAEDLSRKARHSPYISHIELMSKIKAESRRTTTINFHFREQAVHFFSVTAIRLCTVEDSD